MPIANLKDVKLYYEIHGEGYPIILLHGYGATSKIWIAQYKVLSKFFKIIIYDQRCSGISEHSDKDFTLDTLVDDLRDLIRFLNIDKAHLIGQSMGGFVSQNFILKYPQIINKLVLIGTNYKGSGLSIFKNTLKELSELAKTNKQQAFWKYAKFMHHREVIKQLKAEPKKKVYDLFSAEDLIEEFKDNQMTSDDFDRLEKAGSMHNILDRLHEINNPTLIIAGFNDKLSPRLVLDEMNEILSNSKMEIIENAGHHVFLDQAPYVNELIINFLKK